MTSPQPAPLHLETERLRFDRILMATDFSPLAEQALRTAISYANYYQAELQIVHALPPFLPPPELYREAPMVVDGEMREILHQDRETQMRHWPEQYPGLRTIRHEEKLAYGPPDGVIAAAVEEFRPDLIIMGTHGAGGAEAWERGQTPVCAPAFPAAVVDTTGAGDAFAGGMLGYLAQQGQRDEITLRRAVVYGSVMGSFACERFGVERLNEISAADVEARYREFIALTRFDA